jgi:hypothetical protein
MNELTATFEQLLASAKPLPTFDGTVVMTGRTLSPQDKPQPQPQPQPQAASSVPTTTTPRKPRGQGKGKGAPLKDDCSNPSHLWAISGRKGPNEQGTVIYVLGQLGWHEQPRTKFKETLVGAKDAPGTVTARIRITPEIRDENGKVTDPGGQRQLLIG